MKLRYVVIIYILAVVLCGALLIGVIVRNDTEAPDMLDLNSRAGEACSALDEGKPRGDVERDCSCYITLLSDEDYESVNNEWIRDGYAVFDYREDGLSGPIVGKIGFDVRTSSDDESKKDLMVSIIAVCVSLSVVGVLLLFFVWYMYIRPFNELRSFAASVGKGNLDVPLKMKKENYFGAFTESFDMMRYQLKEASIREANADRSKKELVAGLSHDIKTPVATIKATCEVMELKYSSDKDIAEKVSVIKSKASSVESLIDNMFRATLEDLEQLRVEPSEESSLIIDEMISDLRFFGPVEKHGSVPECLIMADRLRLEQVIDNIAGNSFKYAEGSPLEIDFASDEESIRIIFSDRGPGVPEDEIDLLSSKFYRGSVAKGKEGSGLGLYLSTVFMQRMGGGLELHNREGGGFVAEVVIRKV